MIDLEPTHVEDELQEGEERKLKVTDEAVVQMTTPDQAGQHEYVHCYRHYLHSFQSSSLQFSWIYTPKRKILNTDVKTLKNILKH